MGIHSIPTVTPLLAVLLLLLPFLSLTSSPTIDTITSTQTIRDGETIVSANGHFALGFFGPVNSTNRYVGIWYNNKNPQQKPVWVANRDNPVRNSSAMLTINPNGDLLLLNAQNNTLWFANASTHTKNPMAKLLDSGNLVLVDRNSDDGEGRFLWESFDHPSDTFLPTMKLGVDWKTGKKKLLRSWKALSDPSIGVFSSGIDVGNLNQTFIWRNSTPYWRSGPWNGRAFTGISSTDSGYFDGFQLIRGNSEGKVGDDGTYDYFKDSFDSRFELDPSGKFQQLRWDEEMKRYIEVWSAPRSECDFYGKCGPFGVCNQSNTPICRCLKGFQPKAKEEWNKGNWSGGCERRNELQCYEDENSGLDWAIKEKFPSNDWFVEMSMLKLPDSGELIDVLNAKECEYECLIRCACVGYAYVSGIGCMVWSGGLMDIQEFSAGGEELYIRLAWSEKENRRKGNVSAIVLAILVFIILVLDACAYYSWRLMAKQNDATIFEDCMNHDKGAEVKLFDFRIIATATNNFSDDNKLGQGGFGPVYKGKLPEGQEIAVKRLSRSSGQGLLEFKNEVIVISKLQHRNLVKLLGFCITREEKILLYEYMPNKSLDAYLFDPGNREKLDWAKRFNIIEGIARGLLYLHRDSRLMIIHRDLKASNILLDGEMNPKISDFGMARIFGGNQTLETTNRVVGTYGYMSPEYAMAGQFSAKSDVFSFGVLLLEIVSGIRNAGFSHHERYPNLLAYAWILWNEGQGLEFIDLALGYSYKREEVLRCIHIGLLCVQDIPWDRPHMQSIVLMLVNETAILPIPKQPAFTDKGSPPDMDSPPNHEIFSINDASITTCHGR